MSKVSMTHIRAQGAIYASKEASHTPDKWLLSDTSVAAGCLQSHMSSAVHKTLAQEAPEGRLYRQAAHRQQQRRG